MNVSTKQQRIAEMARQSPKVCFTALNHHLDIHLLQEVYRLLRRKSAPGIDGQTVAEYGEGLVANLRSLLDRAKSGDYVAPPVKRVHIPEGISGKETRPIGIPTVSDRVAQTVAKMYLEPIVEPKFHDDSYGSRPGKSALDAVATVRKRCWRRDWVVDLDIKGFFDNLDWNLVMRAVRFHTDLKWLHLYIERWLSAPVEMEDGTRVERTKGSPQGSVISPLLANLFMHHAFDDWMGRNHPNIQFERYVDGTPVQA